MPKSKDLTRYDVAYFDLLSALSTRSLYIMQFASHREAQAFRFDFYAFARALEHSVAQGLEGERANLRIATSFVLKINGGILTFESRDNSPFSKAIKDSFTLNSVAPETPHTPHEATPNDRLHAAKALPAELPFRGKDSTQEAMEYAGYLKPTAIPDSKPTPTPTSSPIEPEDPYLKFMKRKDNDDA